jgi:hypothetical protein
MRTLKNLILAALLAFCLGMISNKVNAQVNDNVSFNVFYESLQPYGIWFDYSDLGMCWRPNGVSLKWEPYRQGHWMWTDYGWTWASDYAWGWAPFHYGRWTYDDFYGWIWVPDYEWSPAWVQWRYDQDYIGWAPLPPKARFTVSIGVDFDDYGINYHHWNYIYARNMADVKYRFVPRQRVYNIHIHTTNITNIAIVNNHIYNYGPRINDVERLSGVKIRQYNIIQDREPNHDKNSYRIDNNDLHVYHPEITRTNGSTRGNNDTRPEIIRNNPPADNKTVERVDPNKNRTVTGTNQVQKPDRGKRNNSQNKNKVQKRPDQPTRGNEVEKNQSRDRNSESKERNRNR